MWRSRRTGGAVKLSLYWVYCVVGKVWGLGEEGVCRGGTIYHFKGNLIHIQGYVIHFKGYVIYKSC